MSTMMMPNWAQPPVVGFHVTHDSAQTTAGLKHLQQRQRSLLSEILSGLQAYGGQDDEGATMDDSYSSDYEQPLSEYSDDEGDMVVPSSTARSHPIDIPTCVNTPLITPARAVLSCALPPPPPAVPR